MFKMVKIAFYVFVLLVLIESFAILQYKKDDIRSSMREIGSGFVNTAQQILNEGGNDLDDAVENIHTETRKYLD